MGSTEADLESQAGKQTGNTGRDRGNRISPVMEWLVAGIVFVAVLAGIFYFGRGLNSGGGGQGGAIGAPAAFVAPDPPEFA
jgi:hypothetical protein